MTFLANYGLFALKTITLVISTLILIAGIAAIVSKPKSKIKITPLNDEYQNIKSILQKKILGVKKEKKKKVKKQNRPSLFVIDFTGDIKANEVSKLRNEITAILSIATRKDEVVIRLESPGGSVNGYGLAASQLQRIRENKIPLTACVDRIAASGGYMMASVADTIIASPFAIIGSIGVVATVPNFHRLLQKSNIDVEMVTAGEFKRTLTMFCENTKNAREKVQEDIEVIHNRFKDHILSHRKTIDIEKVSTGEYWLAIDALPLQLIDDLKTSDEYIIQKMQTHNAFYIEIKEKNKLADKLIKPAFKLMHPFA